MNSRKLLVGCGIVLALGLGIVLIGIIASYLFPKQTPDSAVSILVNINLPLNGAELPLNEPVSIYAEAVSDQPVHDLELWLDGAFSPTKMDSSPIDKSPLSAVWLWTPAEEGAHRLIVRAIGLGGEAVNSNVVRVSVLPREKIADLQVTPIPPEQLPPLETPAADVAFQQLDGPTVTPPPPPFPPEDQSQDPAEPPVGAPSLQGSINQCDAALLIQDSANDEKGFYLYRFDPTSTGFTRVATLDKYPDTGSFTYIDPGLSLGDHTYYIASFDGSGETPSNLINLKVTEAQCAGNGPQALGLQDATLTTTKPVDKVYCYLSVDQGPWKRIPPGSNKFIHPTNGEFDLGNYLNALISPPPPGGVTLELECWGWSGNTLVYLGYLKQDVGKGPVQLIGTDFTLIGLGLDLYDFGSILSPNIAPPYSVAMTNDLGKCTSILTGFYTQPTAASICKQMLASGQSILYWKWQPDCLVPNPTCPYKVKDIDGYHVYKVSLGGNPVQISNSTNGPKLDFANIPPTGAGLIIQPEYFVRAYKGSQESIDSQHVMGIPPKYTETLPSSMMFQNVTYQADFIGSCPAYGPNFQDDLLKGGGSVLVGFDYRASWTGTEDCPVMRTSDYYDATIFFDHREIHGQVNNAILRWKELSGTWIAGDPRKDLGCLIPLLDQNGVIIGNYPLDGESGYDVTTLVSAWVKGLPNKGFTLLSGDRTLAMEPMVPAINICTQKFGDFELEVTTNKP